jgi:RNA polymerase sigma-70 factor (ECF subfamily)
MRLDKTPEKAAHYVPNGCEAERFRQQICDHQRTIFLYAFVLLQNEADAKDVVQETNLVLWRKCHEYRSDTDFCRWACHIAFYEVLKCRQRKSQRERLFTDEFVNMLATELEESWNDLDAHREALRFWLQTLSEEDRCLLMQRYEPGAATRSVAEGLGRSVQGTRTSLHRIRKTLLECIHRTAVPSRLVGLTGLLGMGLIGTWWRRRRRS